MSRRTTAVGAAIIRQGAAMERMAVEEDMDRRARANNNRKQDELLDLTISNMRLIKENGRLRREKEDIEARANAEKAELTEKVDVSRSLLAKLLARNQAWNKTVDHMAQAWGGTGSEVEEKKEEIWDRVDKEEERSMADPETKGLFQRIADDMLSAHQEELRGKKKGPKG